MKKLAIALLLLMGCVTSLTFATPPYTTWTLGPSGILFPMQDAYVPIDEVTLPINGAEELFLAPDGFLYVADTGNGRIIKLDSSFQIVAEFGREHLKSPTGLFIDQDGTFYIADRGNNAIVILDSAGQLVRSFGRPSEPLFGANREFLPRKIVVDARQNLYIVSEGSVNGLVMLNTMGQFIGYFGSNSAEMSLKMILQRLILTDEQLEQFIRNEAASPSNVAIDNRALIYTITAGTQRDKSIRKFNISGKNLFNKSILGSNTFRDIEVSDNGLLIAIDGEGRIFEYDQNGTLLFFFGALERGDQRLGLLSNPTAIERVGNDLYVLDKTRNSLVIYRVTRFAQRLHEGVQLYMNGFYTEARPYFEAVLNDNGLVIMAYQAIADADYKAGNYTNALQYYRYAEDRNGYSEAFWELRNVVLQRHLGSALSVLVVGWVALSLFTRLENRYQWLDGIRQLATKARSIRLWDDFLFLFRFIKQPADSFYSIKQNERGSLTFALLIYVWVVVSHILSLYWTGFLFSPFYAPSWQVQVETQVIYVVVLFILWNTANYLIASITDGEGRASHVVIGTAYSLFPYALFSLPLTLISNLLTLNETFLYSFSTQLMLVWAGIMLVIMVKEIHNYSFSETVRNILATVFTMAIFLLIGYILYVLFNQLYEFILAIVQEASLRG